MSETEDKDLPDKNDSEDSDIEEELDDDSPTTSTSNADRDISKYVKALKETESSCPDSLGNSSVELLSKESFKSDIDQVKIKKDAYVSQLRPCSSCELLEPVTSVQMSTFFGLLTKRKSIERVDEFWLISVPKKDDTWKTLKEHTSKDQLSQNFKFHVPILKVGTLDILVSLIDQLSTLDKFVEETTVKLAKYMKDELEGNPSIFEENLKINNLGPSAYLTRFVWNRAKYPTWHPVPLLADIMYTYVDKIANSLRQKLGLFDNLKSSLKRYERRESDKLQYRYLGDIVNKEHFVLDSKFLVTLVVVVPNAKIKKWLQSYENLTEMVVPQSSQKLFDDGNDSLFNVTLAEKMAKEFAVKAREHMFIVRDFKFDEKHILSENAYYENLTRVKTRQLAAIFCWVKVHFSECFEAWIHVKALRVFVESVLRFGLPVNYEAMLLIPLKSKRKLKHLLQNLYADADVSLASGYIDEIPAALRMYGVEEYHPYVYFKIDLGFTSFYS